MAIVAVYKSGNCTAYFDDSCCVKTQEEIDRILKNVADIYVRYFTRVAMEEARKERLKECQATLNTNTPAKEETPVSTAPFSENA